MDQSQADYNLAGRFLKLKNSNILGTYNKRHLLYALRSNVHSKRQSIIIFAFIQYYIKNI
jgi:hypothetical protein